MDNDKIVMRWTEGRLKGAASVVRRSTIKSRATVVEKKVTVLWGKAKKAYNTEVVNDDSITAPQQATSNDEEPLLFELADSALGEPSSSSSGAPPHKDRWPALIEKMERLTHVVSGMEVKIAMVGHLTDVMSGMEATMLWCFRTIEDKLMRLQDRTAAFQGAYDWHWPEPPLEDIPVPALPSFPDVQTPLPPLKSTALADVSNRSVGGGLQCRMLLTRCTESSSRKFACPLLACSCT